jgi:hypothetical protein
MNAPYLLNCVGERISSVCGFAADGHVRRDRLECQVGTRFELLRPTSVDAAEEAPLQRCVNVDSVNEKLDEVRIALSDESAYVASEVSRDVADEESIWVASPHAYGMRVVLIAEVQHEEERLAFLKTGDSLKRGLRHPADAMNEELVKKATIRIGNWTRKELD